MVLESQKRLVTPVFEVLRVPDNLDVFRLSHTANLLILLEQVLNSRLQLFILTDYSLKSIELKLGLLEKVFRNNSFLIEGLLDSEVFFL